MKAWLILTAFAFLTTSQAEEEYIQYEEVEIKRFVDELRHLGIDVPDYTKPDHPKVKIPPVVSAPAGEFTGFWTLSQFGRPIASFEGIPFAQPPVGPLRFKVAEPLPRLSSPFNATKPGNICVQMISIFTSVAVYGDENCLFINVYVPETTNRTETELLPVIFYIHWGAFVMGTGSLTKPGILLDKDVVLVTFNYRLGPLGFLTTEDEVIPGNLGLKDQVAALLWTKENIASFGGNPNLITVYGLSAGSASADFITISPLTKGLIHRVISSSGSANGPWALGYPGEMLENVGKAARFLSCPAEPSEALLACLQNRTAAEITGVAAMFWAWGQTISIPFKAVVEGDVPGALLPYHPKILSSLTNRSNDVPFLTGVVSEEGTIAGSMIIFNNASLLQYFDKHFLDVIQPMLIQPKDEKTKPKFEILKEVYFGNQTLQRSQGLLATNLFTDFHFIWPTMQSVQSRMNGSKSSAYFYYFNYKGSRTLWGALGLDTSGCYGVNHADDALYISPYPGKPTPEDVKMSMIYSDLFANFARDGMRRIRTGSGNRTRSQTPSTNVNKRAKIIENPNMSVSEERSCDILQGGASFGLDYAESSGSSFDRVLSHLRDRISTNECYLAIV